MERASALRGAAAPCTRGWLRSMLLGEEVVGALTVKARTSCMLSMGACVLWGADPSCSCCLCSISAGVQMRPPVLVLHQLQR